MDLEFDFLSIVIIGVYKYSKNNENVTKITIFFVRLTNTYGKMTIFRYFLKFYRHLSYKTISQCQIETKNSESAFIFTKQFFLI
jgi:hypothetical protein